MSTAQLPAGPAVVCSALSLEWPDGTVALDRLDAAFGSGRTGLIGGNGSGKSTLLRLIAGRLQPTSGSITVSGTVDYRPQDMAATADRSMAQLIGIDEQRMALHAIESGDVDPAHYAVLGDNWDVEERSRAELARFGLPDDLDRAVGGLSVGEAVLAALVGTLVRGSDITLLDEPTNNLDRVARDRLYPAITAWTGVLVVVTHDRELLELVDAIAHLRGGSVRVHGGTFASYTEVLEIEEAAAQQRLRTAETELRRERRQLVEAETKLDRRRRFGRKAFEEKRMPRVKMNELKRAAQVSEGKHRIDKQHDVAEAQDAVAAAEDAAREDDRIRITLLGTAVPAGRTIVDATRQGQRLTIRGPERIGLIGPNGSGKTTLLRALTGAAVAGPAAQDLEVVPVPVPIAYLPQRLDILDDAESALDNVRAVAARATEQDVRAGLARFLLRGDRVHQLAGSLSGGERFRVSLARLLLADPPPQLLILDEPTNNLDLDSVEQLLDALAAFRGALIVASHDRPFLDELGITGWWQL